MKNQSVEEMGRPAAAAVHWREYRTVAQGPCASTAPSAVATLRDPLGDPPVECDGVVRLAPTVLTDAGIPHRCCSGTLAGPGRSLPHWWFELDGGHRVDCRARLGFGPEAPPGVVADDRGFVDAGKPVAIAPLSPALFAVLTTPIAWPEGSA